MSVARAGEGLAAAEQPLQVRFDGAAATTIAPGAIALSDPVDLKVAAVSDLVVSLYVREGVALVDYPTWKGAPIQARVDGNDQSMALRLSGERASAARSLLSKVDVLPDRSGRVVAAFGDSITDGLTGEDGERGWPGGLARRLADRSVSVVNAGIGGNRLLSGSVAQRAGLARLESDVLVLPGLTHIVLLEGINDIGNSSGDYEAPLGPVPTITAEDLVNGYQQVIAKAHLRGIKVIGATILPFDGAFYYTSEREAIRVAVNRWIRSSGAFDGVLDFEAVVRDAEDPGKIRVDLASDPLHPNSKGYRLMAEAIDLSLFE